MDYQELNARFTRLTTAHLADACIRTRIAVRCGPPALQAIIPTSRLAGRVCPAQHVGSVDIFLEAIENASVGDVLVVDNKGRLDESCVGDLVVLEAQAAGLNGVVIWGLSRDTADIRRIGLPVFSLGTLPTGPQRLDSQSADALEWATVGEWKVGREDLVFGDEDGVIFIPASQATEVFSLAEAIRDTEHNQAEQMRAGTSLRAQLDFKTYLALRQRKPNLTFRDYLRGVGGAIEE